MTQPQNMGDNELHLGQSKAVAIFQIRQSTSGERLSNVRVTNTGSTVAFGSKGIKQFQVFRDRNNNGVWDSPDSPAIGKMDFTGTSYANPQTCDADFSSTDGDVTSTTNFFIVYTVYERAQTDTTTYVDVVSAMNSSSTWYTFPASNYSYNVVTSGLTYVTSGFEVLLPTDKKIAAGLTDVPITKFTLRSTDYDVTLRTITFQNTDKTFITRVQDRQSGVYRVALYLDDGDNKWTGKSQETLLVNALLPVSPTNSTTILNLYIPTANRPTILKYVDDTHTNDKVFYVLYDIGAGYPDGGTGSWALYDATAYSVSTSNFVLQGGVPAGAVQFTIKGINVLLLTSSQTASANGDSVRGGQKNVPMVNLRLNISQAINDATWVVYNKDGSFKDMDDGVGKVSIYKKPASSDPILIAASSQRTDPNNYKLTGIYMPKGDNQDYYISYDFGINAGDTSVTSKSAQCQLQTIQDGNVVFYGVVPGPEPAGYVIVSPSQVWVEFISSNVSTVQPGQTFYIDVGVRNISCHVDSWTNPLKVTLLANLCQPKFYANDINGNDISGEYTVTQNNVINLNLYTPPYPPSAYQDFLIVTLNYKVTASNLRTNGRVLIDAQLGYENPDDQSPVLYTRHYYGGEMIPAARTYDTPRTSTVKVITASGSTGKSVFPTYIDRVEVYDDKYTTTAKRFVNEDIVAANSVMKIYFINSGASMDYSSLTVKLNGEIQHAQKNNFRIDQANGYIYIEDLGVNSGLVTVEGYSGETALQTAYIYFNVENGFTAKDLSSYPNPYNPDAGDCLIGFNVSQECDYDIYIYDSSGSQLLKEENIKARIGYNTYSWSGERKNGGKKVGRGVYLVKIKAKGSKDVLLSTKIGVI